MQILLTTLNARYVHASIGLRYLYANLKELQAQTSIQEYVINSSLHTIAEKILQTNADIIGIGVYIWNALEVEELVHIIKSVAPEKIVVLGGPEVSHSPLRQDWSRADYIIQGEGELTFYKLCKQLTQKIKPTTKIVPAVMADVKDLELPYAYYTDMDVAHRYTYIEASRGCPFTCEFCLSSIDKRVRYFDLEKLLKALATLWQRGVRNFKFIDRTFNINMEYASKLLDFFLEKEEPFLVHFEVIPDHFPEAIKERIKLFKPASLQLEVGIQTLNPKISENINRKLKLQKIKQNLAFLEQESYAHLHVDLIIGLPGESLESFAQNLDLLCSLTRCEIQLGILKKLSGTTISRHDKQYEMLYSHKPPYEILQNTHISFAQMQVMKRFVRYWDMLYNSGNFNASVRLIFNEEKVYEGFYDFSLWLYEKTQTTYKFALERLAKLVFEYLCEEKLLNKELVANALIEDMLSIKGRNLPNFLKPFAKDGVLQAQSIESKLSKRQAKHATKR